MKTDRGFYLFFLALLVVFAVHAAYLACPAEDAFIAFRFAKNLAHGHGLTWNAGEPPVEGYTNFLWVLLCSLAIDLELDPRVCAQILGIIAGMAALFYAYLYSKDLLGAGAVRSLLPCLMLALSGPFAAWTSGGMETGLFTLLVLMSCYYFASFWKRRAAFSMYIASASVFLATLTRPEGFMVWAALALLCFVLRDARTRSRDLAGPAVLYLFPLLIYVSWRYRYFGFLLPNTYYAKTDWTVYQALRGGLYAAFFGLYFILPLLPPIVYAHRKRERPAPGWNAVRARLREHPGTPTCFWICLVYTLYIILIGGDYMAMFRFFAPLMPLIYILFGASTSMPHSPASTSPRPRRAAAGLIALSAGLTLLPPPSERFRTMRT
ncbi:MAG: glycosyltransferase family 39 protein [Chitinivibrionia bacterium]|nr:glycosyltransferase family 39 protein [Chitinivibrionia bacterium]